MWGARNPKYFNVIGGKINKLAAIQKWIYINDNNNNKLQVLCRWWGVGRGGSADITVETSWRCVQLPKLHMIDCGCIFQIQSRLNLHEISAPQATFLSSPACDPVALWRRGKSCCLGFGDGDKHLPGSLYTAKGFLAGAQARRCRDMLPNLRASATRVTSQ